MKYILSGVPIFTEPTVTEKESHIRINHMRASDISGKRILAVHDQSAEGWFTDLEKRMAAQEFCLDRVADGCGGMPGIGAYREDFCELLHLALLDYDIRVVVISLSDRELVTSCIEIVKMLQPQAEICYAVADEHGEPEVMAQQLAHMATSNTVQAPARSGAAALSDCENGREGQQWVNFRIGDRHCRDRILLVGDSISAGYYDPVRQGLPAEMALDAVQSGTDVADPDFIRCLNFMLDRFQYRCIHINVGLHTSENDKKPGAYRKNLDFLFHYLKSRCPDAKLIWASTTTAVLSVEPEIPDTEQNTFQMQRNAVAAELCARYGVAIDDLWKISVHHCPARADKLHYKNYQPFASSVLRSLASCLIE